jgi:SAM-dependent methyltransferase
MLGRATANLDAPPRRWLRRLWGIADINVRQKWHLLWPRIAMLPRHGVRLLDAGCGDGDWSLELAVRRPEWQIVGIDRDAAALERAERARARLALPNVSFAHADFLEFRDADRFDVVLSVASAHYLAEQGKGVELFARFRDWLLPGGHLVLLGPQRTRDVWFAPFLARPDAHPVFTAEELEELCRKSALDIDELSGCVGPLATVAKQFDWEAERRGATWAVRALYPVKWSLTAVDARLRFRDRRHNLMWVLVATAAAEPQPARSSASAHATPHETVRS